MKLIDKKKFAVAELDVDTKIFIIYMATLNIEITNIYLFQLAQIRLFKANKAFNTIFVKYFDYADIFLSKLTAKLPRYTNINNYTI